jgi:hypothetical protein
MFASTITTDGDIDGYDGLLSCLIVCEASAHQGESTINDDRLAGNEAAVCTENPIRDC